MLWINKKSPRELPDWVYYFFRGIVTLSANLSCVEELTYIKREKVNLIRIFDPMKVPDDVEISDFHSLDDHRELILFEGQRNEKTGEIKLAQVGK